MEKDKLLRNIPLELIEKIKKLNSGLWEKNNPVAIQLSMIIDEYEAEAGALEDVFTNYEKHFCDKLSALKEDHATERAGLVGEAASLKERVRVLEGVANAGSAKVNELRTALEKCESASREKYTKDEVNMLEQQILELKKELGEFRQLKEIDNRRIMELEGMVSSKAAEVERRFIGRTALLEKECSELKTRGIELEKAKVDDNAKIKELRAELDKLRIESREKYTKDEVNMLELQILDLKKEVGEFRQLKEIDDRRIMELEEMVGSKAAEVERRFIGRTTLLEKECTELRTRGAELEKAKAEDDARIKGLRAELEKIKTESRDKYTREEVTLLEQQILELKTETVEFRRLKDLDEKRIAELEVLLTAKTDDVEQKFVGRIAMLESRVAELKALSDELEKVNSQNEKRMAEMKRLLVTKDREIGERYAEGDVKHLEEMIAALRQEVSGLKRVKIEDEKKIAELEMSVGTKKETIENKYVGRIAVLEAQLSEAAGDLARIEKMNEENAAKAAEMRKAAFAKESENSELKGRLADLEMQFNGLKDNYLSEQRRQDEVMGRVEQEALAKMMERKKELESEYLSRAGKLKTRTEALEAEYESKLKNLSVRERLLEEDFAANKRELIRTFDKIRLDLERRENQLAQRESGAPPSA